MVKALRKVRKFFKWLWHGKSISSYIAFIVVAYFLLKFVAFPLFLLTFGLNDVVAVLSGSMIHNAGTIELTFNEWLEFYDFNESDYHSWPFSNGLNIGDVITVHSGELNVGDVVVYYYGKNMIIHRVVNKTVIDGESYLTTKGDANPKSLAFEVNIPVERIVGKAGLSVPLLGWPRVLMYYLIGF